MKHNDMVSSINMYTCMSCETSSPGSVCASSCSRANKIAVASESLPEARRVGTKAAARLSNSALEGVQI